jgi:hypothetical protein
MAVRADFTLADFPITDLNDSLAAALSGDGTSAAGGTLDAALATAPALALSAAAPALFEYADGRTAAARGAAVVDTSGARVRQWTTLAGAQNPTLTAYANQPDLAQTGVSNRPALTFTSARSTRLAAAGFNTGNTVTVFARLRVSAFDWGTIFATTAGSLTQAGMHVSQYGDAPTGRLYIRAKTAAGAQSLRITASGLFTAGDDLLVKAVANQPGNALELELSVNGGAWTSRIADTMDALGAIASANGAVIGAHHAQNEDFLNGSLAELWVWNRTLNPVEDAAVKAYLAAGGGWGRAAVGPIGWPEIAGGDPRIIPPGGTVAASDHRALLVFTDSGGGTVNVPDAATLRAGRHAFHCRLLNGGGEVALDGPGTNNKTVAPGALWEIAAIGSTVYGWQVATSVAQFS